jgi:hypothetical protein
VSIPETHPDEERVNSIQFILFLKLWSRVTGVIVYFEKLITFK